MNQKNYHRLLICVDNLIFRHTELKKMLVLSGQKRQPCWWYVYSYFRIACPYLATSVFVVTVAVAAYVYFDNGIYIYIGGGRVSLIALLFSLFVDPYHGALPAINEFVRRSEGSGYRSSTIVCGIPNLIKNIEYTRSVLNKCHRITSIILFLLGLGVGAISFLF